MTTTAHSVRLTAGQRHCQQCSHSDETALLAALFFFLFIYFALDGQQFIVAIPPLDSVTSPGY